MQGVHIAIHKGMRNLSSKKLPDSEGYDSIMTITNHDCTKAVILVLCQEKIDAKGVVKLFKDHVFPFVGLPKKIISDRDP
jgi:hypothetical protein